MRRGVALVLAAALLAGCQAKPEASTSRYLEARRAAGIADCPKPAPGGVEGGLPAVSLECLGGDSRVSLDGLRGPLLVHFWAQWCEPCRAEMPMLGRVLPGYAGRLEVLLVTTKEPRLDYAIEFARDTGVLVPQVVDPEMSVPAALGMATGIPQSVLVDASGRVVSRHAGAWDEASLRRELADKLGVTP